MLLIRSIAKVELAPGRLTALMLLIFAATVQAPSVHALDSRLPPFGYDCEKAFELREKYLKLANEVNRNKYFIYSNLGRVQQDVDFFNSYGFEAEPFVLDHSGETFYGFRALPRNGHQWNRIAKYSEQYGVPLVTLHELPNRAGAALMFSYPGESFGSKMLWESKAKALLVGREEFIKSLYSPFKTTPAIRHELVHLAVIENPTPGIRELANGFMTQSILQKNWYYSESEVPATLESLIAMLQPLADAGVTERWQFLAVNSDETAIYGEASFLIQISRNLAESYQYLSKKPGILWELDKHPKGYYFDRMPTPGGGRLSSIITYGADRPTATEAQSRLERRATVFREVYELFSKKSPQGGAVAGLVSMSASDFDSRSSVSQREAQDVVLELLSILPSMKELKRRFFQ